MPDFYGSDPDALYSVEDPYLDPMAAPLRVTAVQPPPVVQAIQAAPVVGRWLSRAVPPVPVRPQSAQAAPTPLPARPAPASLSPEQRAQLPTVPGTTMPQYPREMPPGIAPQYGGNYMPPKEDWAANLQGLIKADKISPENAADAFKARQEYDNSIPGMAANLQRLQGVREQIPGLTRVAEYERTAADLDAERKARLAESIRQDELDARQAANDEARRRAVAAETEKLRAAQQKVADARIDPNHYWANKSTGDKVMSRIALFLGALGQGLTKGALPNQALAMMQADIDRDIAAQQDNLNNARQSAADQGSLLAVVRRQFDDMDQAVLASRAILQRNLASTVENIALDSGSKTALMRGKALATDLRLAAEQDESEIKLRAAAIWEQQQMAMLAGRGAKQKSDNLDQVGWLNFDDKETQARLVGDTGYIATTPEQATKILDSLAQTRAAVGMLKRLDSLLAKGNSIGSDERAQAKSIQAQLPQVLTAAFGGGAAGDQEAKRYGDGFNPNWSSTSIDNARAQLSETVRTLESRTRAELEARGASPIQGRIVEVKPGVWQRQVMPGMYMDQDLNPNVRYGTTDVVPPTGSGAKPVERTSGTTQLKMTPEE